MISESNFNFLLLLVAIAALLFAISHLVAKSTSVLNSERNKIILVLRFGLYLIVYSFFISQKPEGLMENYGLTLPDERGWLLTSLLAGFVIMGCYFQSRKESVHGNRPILKFEKWNLVTHGINALSWITYLFAYEFLLRGVVLFESMHRMDPVLAIALNIFIYVLVHLPKGKLEIFGSIPMGIVLCMVTLNTNSIIPALVIHASVAVSVDIFSVPFAKGRRGIMLSR